MRNLMALPVFGMTAFLYLTPQTTREEPQLQTMTPILTVDAIEPCLPFWTEALGFELTASVPAEGGLSFAMLQLGTIELMYQTRSSLDLGGAPVGLGIELVKSTTTLFITVADLGAAITAIGSKATVVVPRRQTEYQMDEIFLRTPCGTLVGLAARLNDGD